MVEVFKKKTVLILLVIDLLITAAAGIVHPAFSIYELLMLFYSIGCTGLFFCMLKEKMISFNTVSVLKLMCLLLLGVAGYSTMTYGQANIHADTAIATLLARAEINHCSLIPKTWCYANGDIWILDTQLAVMPFSLIMKDQVTARMLGTLVMMIFGMVSIYLLDRSVLKAEAYVISLPVLFVFIFGGDKELIWGNDHINYQASYTCWLTFIPVMCILTYLVFIEGKRSKALMAAYFILSVICMARGIRAIAEIMIPLAIAYPVYILIDNGCSGLKKWKDYLIFLLPMLIGCIFYKVLCMTHIVNTSETSGTVFADNLESVFENTKIVLLNMFSVFGYNEGCSLVSVSGLANLVSITCCILFLFVMPLAELRYLKNEPEGIRFFFVFGYIHNAEMLVSTIFFDKTSDSHILTFVIVSIMMSSIFVMRHWIGDEKHAFIYGTLFVTASLIMALQLGLASRGWQGKKTEKRASAETLMEHGLDECKGYGTFWNIYPLSIYSDLKLDVAAIGNSDIALALAPHLNLVDTDKYIPEQKGSYILLDYNENQEVGDGLEEIFGTCREKFNIGENFIYVWDYDVAENGFEGK